MKTIIITGGTGLIGKALVQKAIEKKYDVIVLSRQSQLVETQDIPSISNMGSVKYVYWNVERKEIDANVFKNANAIIHLAGTSIAEKRWTKTHKESIVRSRVEAGQFLMDCLKKYPNQIETFISASAIGWYGHDNPNQLKRFKETDLPAEDLIGNTCVHWEKSVTPFHDANKRLIIVRTGIVLSSQGGALQKLAATLRYRLKVILGQGQQIMSWIDIEDLCAIYFFLLESNYYGVYNAVAPNPVTSKKLTDEIFNFHTITNYLSLNIPPFMLNLLVGELSTEILKSCTVSSSKIESIGYTFKYPTIEQSLSNHLAAR